MKCRMGLWLWLSMCSLGMLQAQKIEFSETEHHFGTVSQESDPLVHEFRFTNTGDKSLVIYRVSTTCGCTTPYWSAEPIAPGKSGTVKVSFEPSERKGVFTKNIMVDSNDKAGTKTLYIKGTIVVEAKEERLYPVKEGDLLLKTTQLSFGKLGSAAKKTVAIEIYNRGTSPMEITAEPTEGFVQVLVNPRSLEPKKKGMIFVTVAKEKIKNGPAFRSLFTLKATTFSTERKIPVSVDGSM